MKLLVTGGSGFLGQYVLAAAARRGLATAALARSDAAAAVVAARGAQPVQGDLDEPAHLGDVFAAAGCDALVNLASLGFGHAPAIVAAARSAGLTRCVFVSTTAVTTRLPARSREIRLAAEEQIRLSGLDWTIVRPTMIYGAAGDRNLSRLLALLHRAPVLPVPGSGRRLQQPVHVADVADAVLAAVTSPAAAGACYDVAGPQALTFRAMLHMSAGAVGSRTRLIPVPLAAVTAAVRCYERISPRPRIRAEQIQRLAENKAFSIEAAAHDLGYAPRPFGDGIRAEAAGLGLRPGRPAAAHETHA